MSLLLAIDLGDLVQLAFVLLVILGSLASQLLKERPKQPRRPVERPAAPPRPAHPAGPPRAAHPAGPPRAALEREIEAFLGSGPQAQPAQPAPPHAAGPGPRQPAQPIPAELVGPSTPPARPPRRTATDRRSPTPVRRGPAGAAQPSRSTGRSLADDAPKSIVHNAQVATANERLHDQLYAAFDHSVGQLSSPTPTTATDKDVQAAGEPPGQPTHAMAPRAVSADQLVQWFRDPMGLRQAIVLQEILNRPYS